MSIEKALSKIYKPVNSIHSVPYTEDVSTILIDTVNKTTSTPTEFLKKPITIPIIYLSPTTASNDKFDTWLVITLTLIAICLLLIVTGILYCYFSCFKRLSNNKNSVQSPDISKNDEPVDVDVKILNRKSLAETIYLTVPSTVKSIPEISDDLSFSDVEDLSESIHLRRDNTFTILD